VKKKIESLTDEQKSKFQFYIKKWTDIGLSTEPSNRKEAEKGIVQAYKSVGLKKPKIVWTTSPLASGLTRHFVQKIKDKKIDIGDSVGDSVWASVRASVGDSVRASVGDSVWDSVRASVRDSVRDSVRASVWDSVWASGYGQHDANWIGFYDYFRNECGLNEETENLQGLTKVCENSGWFLPHENIVWISERHQVLKTDDLGRLHCENGPALSYPDGWSIYAWHGVRIPKEWIEDKNSITPSIALTWKNTEQRRAAIEIVGWDNVLQQLNPRTIDKDNDPQIGELIEVKHQSIGEKPERFLRVQCGTGRYFSIPCPPEMKTALQANAWTWGLKDYEYQPEIRT
jgi:hypothetical protein